MRLSAFTDYSIRLLIYLAAAPTSMARIKDVSDAYNISRNHLMKVASHLNRAGFITTQRGPGGGLKLAREASEINLSDVVMATEEEWVMAECFTCNNQCVITPWCKSRCVLTEALSAFHEVLFAYTLEQMVESRSELIHALDLGAGCEATGDRPA